MLHVFSCILHGIPLLPKGSPTPRNLEVVPEDLRMKVIYTLLCSLVGTFLWDRLCLALFAPHIMAAQLQEAQQTSWKDFLPVLKTAGMIIGGGLLLVSGNPILWGAAFMMYRRKPLKTRV